jgi:hypothetical protein
LFKADAGKTVFYFCKDEVATVILRSTDDPLDLWDDDTDVYNVGRTLNKSEGLLIRTQFVGTNNKAEITGVDRLSYNNNYFCGNDPANWVTDVPNFSSIIYKDIY